MIAIYNLLSNIIEIYIWLVIASAVLSWLIQFRVINTHNRAVYVVVDFLHRITEPALKPIRRLIHQILPNLGGVDISPVLLILGLVFVQNLLVDIFF